MQDSIDRVSSGFSDVRYAFTSGSTSQPKRIPYTRRRLHQIKRASFEAVTQAAEAYRIKSPTLFVLAAMQKDDSLSSLLLEENSKSAYLEGVVMPSGYIRHPGLASVIENYGPMAVRLCLMVLSNPGILYGTNPSTLASFLHAVEHDWMKNRRLLCDVATKPDDLSPNVRKVLQKVVIRGWHDRALLAASSIESPGLQKLVPALSCFCCWDGGYVKPFLDVIREYLPKDQFHHVPMYSMSTECLQTKVYYVRKVPHYLPVASGTLYEFLPEGVEDIPDNLLKAIDLEEGESYSMVVSDAYGLKRYQTDDVFLCVDKVGAIPDLRFIRRRGLTYSFTGEKITGQQAEAACTRLRESHSLLEGLGAQMTLIPAASDAGDRVRQPHYRLVIACTAALPPAGSELQLSRDFDESLSEQNLEFAAKRDSGRLGASRVLFMDYDRFARLMKNIEFSKARNWENQFKLVPLYTKRWDELGLPTLETLQ